MEISLKTSFNTSEAHLQSACVVWFKNTYREYRALYYQVKNDGKKNIIAASSDKAMGLTAGIPDTHLAIPRGHWHSLYIEFKLPGQYLSAAQKEVIPQLREQGHRVEVVTSEEQFKSLIEEYISLYPYAGTT